MDDGTPLRSHRLSNPEYDRIYLLRCHQDETIYIYVCVCVCLYMQHTHNMHTHLSLPSFPRSFSLPPSLPSSPYLSLFLSFFLSLCFTLLFPKEVREFSSRIISLAPRLFLFSATLTIFLCLFSLSLSLSPSDASLPSLPAPLSPSLARTPAWSFDAHSPFRLRARQVVSLSLVSAEKQLV